MKQDLSKLYDNIVDYAPAGYKSCFHGVIPKGDGLNLDSPGSWDEGHPFPASEGRALPSTTSAFNDDSNLFNIYLRKTLSIKEATCHIYGRTSLLRRHTSVIVICLDRLSAYDQGHMGSRAGKTEKRILQGGLVGTGSTTHVVIEIKSGVVIEQGRRPESAFAPSRGAAPAAARTSPGLHNRARNDTVHDRDAREPGASHESVLTRARWSVGDRREGRGGEEEDRRKRGEAASASCTGATGDSADLCARDSL
ncbi:unnamed protein product [Danaus chrysippus]|uniref:(African queen) hypothetical protein n=1 Tax=Danaus chrysippus TaxID=151541 RepID=A0A8J2R7X0_9NEOP|nr:unnamed protein product [Danaus chrysippus]